MLSQNKMSRLFLFLLILGLVYGFSSEALAAEKDPNNKVNYFEMSLEELMDVPVIFSASRQAQKAGELSVPVSVITHEDIHYSGLTNIPEILQFTPGVDVLQMDRNSYAVGIRGIHGRYSNRMLSLLDGRTAESPVWGGPEFERLPLFLEDIERIEVIRGPGGAAWGANAFTGVINIITKDPRDCLGWFASTTFNNFGDSYTHLRYAEEKGKWRWRVSAGYEGLETSEDAIHDDSFASDDRSRRSRYDFKAIYDHSETIKLTLGGGYSHLDSGNFDSGNGSYTKKMRRFDTVRSYAKIDKIYSDTTTAHIQWTGNYAITKFPDALNTFSAENDFEGQINFVPAENHKMSIGGNFRWIHIDSKNIGGDQGYTLSVDSADEYLAGVFLIDRWKVTDRLTLEGQVRGDWYSETQVDWSGRATALYTLDKEKQRILRFSVAKSFRTPMLTQRQGQKHSGTHFIPGLYWFNIIDPEDLKNEETWSLEAGYSEQLTKNLTLRTDLYYQRFERLIGDKTLTDTLGWGRTLEILDNLGGADSYGWETELTAKTEVGEFSAWYALNKFLPDEKDQQMDAYQPAQHKAALTARIFLPHDTTLNMNYRITSLTNGNSADLSTYTSPGVSHRFDVSLAKKIAKGNGEIMFGVSNLFDKTNNPVGELWAFETPGRTFFARLQLKF